MTACLLKVLTFFKSICGKISLKVVYGWIAKKLPKKWENTIYLRSAVYQQTNEYEIYLHAADVNYHHDRWLCVTIKDIPAA